MYAMVCTRSDLAYAVSTVSQSMSSAVKQHCEAMKWVLRYLRETATRLGVSEIENGKA